MATLLSLFCIPIISKLNSLFGLQLLKNVFQFSTILPQISDLYYVFQTCKKFFHKKNYYKLKFENNIKTNNLNYCAKNAIKTNEKLIKSIDLCIDILSLIFCKYNLQQLQNQNVLDLKLFIYEIIETIEYLKIKWNFANVNHCRIILAPSFIITKPESLKIWRRYFKNKIFLNAAIINQNSNLFQFDNYGLSHISHALEDFTNDEICLYSKLLINYFSSDYLNKKSYKKKFCQDSNNIFCKKTVENDDLINSKKKINFYLFNKFLLDKNVQTFDYLNKQNFSVKMLCNPIFLFITQPGVIIQLFKSANITSIINEKLANPFNGLKELLKQLEFFLTNIEFMIELRRSMHIHLKLSKVHFYFKMLFNSVKKIK